MKVPFANDWAFMGLVDGNTFSVSLTHATFDYSYLAELVAAQMSLERVVAWGTPECEFSVEFFREPPSDTGVYRSFTQCLTASGRICLSSFDSFVDACLFPEHPIPGDDDVIIPLTTGRYAVTVQQLFDWDETTQFPANPEEEVKYRVFILPADDGHAAGPISKVPWTAC